MDTSEYIKKLLINPLTGGAYYSVTNRQNPTEKHKNDLNDSFHPLPSSLQNEERYKKILSVGAECQLPKELKELVDGNKFIYCYDGFEPSGRMHIAQGILRTINVNKLIDSGCIFIFWIADWFAMLNGKLNGDLEKIRTVGKYFIEIWKAAGMKMHNVKFIWASDYIKEHASEYWMQVMNIGCKYSLDRIKRCSTIMGREESDNLKVSQLLYPLMQCSDIFSLDIDICQLGIDQKKVNMLARDYCSDTHRKKTPVIISQNMISGLKEGELKMSKSSGSAIFMEDGEEDVRRKIKSAFCEEGNISENPCLEFVKYFIIENGKNFNVKRAEKYGGDISYNNFEQIQNDFKDKKLHPGDLKKALAEGINNILDPIRKHFSSNPEAAKLFQLVKKYKEEQENQNILESKNQK